MLEIRGARNLSSEIISFALSRFAAKNTLLKTKCNPSLQACKALLCTSENDRMTTWQDILTLGFRAKIQELKVAGKTDFANFFGKKNVYIKIPNLRGRHIHLLTEIQTWRPFIWIKSSSTLKFSWTFKCKYQEKSNIW